MNNWNWHGKEVMAYRDLTEAEVLLVKNGEGYNLPKCKQKMFRGNGAFERACKWRSQQTQPTTAAAAPCKHEFLSDGTACTKCGLTWIEL